MKNFYKPDYSIDPNSPFARDSNNKLIRKNYWYALQDSSVISLFNSGLNQISRGVDSYFNFIDYFKVAIYEAILFDVFK